MVTKPAASLPAGTVVADGDQEGYTMAGGGKTTKVVCVDASYGPVNGRYSAQQLTNTSVKGLSRDELLRILYVGYFGDAKNYSKKLPYDDGSGYSADVQFWVATQYAVTSYTNGEGAANDTWGNFIDEVYTPIEDVINDLIKAAKDTSIVIPEGSQAYLYTSRGNQPAVAASFPTVTPVTQGSSTEVRLGNYKQPDTPTTPSSGEFVIINKVDENGNTLAGATLHVEDAQGNTIQAKYYDETGKELNIDLGSYLFVSPSTGKVTAKTEKQLPAGTYYVVEDFAPEGYTIDGDGRYEFEIKATGSTTQSGPAVGSTTTVVGTGTYDGIIRGTGSMELADKSGLAFCVTPQADFLWEKQQGSASYSYTTLAENQVNLSTFGEKTPNITRSGTWVNALPRVKNAGLTPEKMEQVKKILWATYDYMLTGDAGKDPSGIIKRYLGSASFPQTGVYHAAEVAIAEIISPGCTNFGLIGNSHDFGNVATLAKALIGAAKGEVAYASYFAAYTHYSIVYLQTSDPATQNLITPGNSVAEVTISNTPDVPHEPKPGEVELRKTDQNGNLLAGAKLQILNASKTAVVYPKGATVDSLEVGNYFESNDQAPIKVSLPVGTYYLHEVQAPEGYQQAEDQIIRVVANGSGIPASSGTAYSNDAAGTTISFTGSDGKTYPAYCLQLGRNDPQPWGTSYSEASSSALNKLNTSVTYGGFSGRALEPYVKRVLYAAFSNAGGVLNGLTSEEAYAATAMAINYFTDYNSNSGGVSYHTDFDNGNLVDKRFGAHITKAAKALRDYGLNTGFVVPSTFVTKYYTANGDTNNTYQVITVVCDSPSITAEPVTMVDYPKPVIGTQARASETDDHIALANGQVTINDTVAYKGLVAGRQYTMKGQLVRKSDRKVLAEAEARFWAAANGTGTVELAFTVDDARQLAGDSVVVFETCYYGNQEVAVHADINDEGQTVHFPEVHTNATDKANGNQVVEAGKDVTVVDKVTYTNLIVGREYTVSGKLVKKSDKNSVVAYATKTFTATEQNGFVELEFTFNTSALAGESVVAFEKVYYGDDVVAIHEDINDNAQTVEVENPKINIPGTKTWDDSDNQDGKRPASITIRLWNGDTEVASKEVTADDNWEWEFTNLPKYANGEPITYTVTEDAVKDYTTTPDGYNFTNSYTPGETSVSVSKVWVDSNNANDKRPAFVTVNLLADGEVVDSVELSSENGWAHTFTGLPINEAGRAIEYTVKEVVVEGYASTITGDAATGFTVTNEEPEIEKYVNLDVDAHLVQFDRAVRYDILGYVTHDAESFVITDTLVNALEFADKDGNASTDADAVVTAIEVKADNNHEANTGTVREAGTAVNNATVTLDGKTLSVKVADASAYRGQWVQVTFWAKYTDETIAAAEVADSQKITDNGAVLTQIKEHEGTANKASYTITASNGSTYSSDSNTVTHDAEDIDVSAKKVWQDAAGGTIEWPADVAEVKVNVIQKDAAGNKKVVDTITLNAQNPSGTSKKLPQLVDVEYVIDETTQVPGYSSTTTDGNIIINKKDDEPEEPELEKYVNKDVHKNIDLDEVFTYDVLAYITRDADRAEITDTLVDDLQFVSTEEQVTIVDLGETVDHTPHGSVAQAGSEVANTTVAIDGQTLTVTIDPANDVRGHWVKVTFDAKIADGKTIEDLTYATITQNTPVLTDEEHTGVPNDASYTISVGNEGKYRDESNTVTVEPEPEDPTVKTKAEAGDGTNIVKAAANQTVIDTVTLDNLVIGREYTVEGKLMIKDGSENGTPLATYTCEPLTFTAEATSEIKQMAFTGVDASGLAKGQSLVVFETLTWEFEATTQAVPHEDINDEAQTVDVEEPEDITVTFSKQDLGGKEIGGAKIQVKDAAGTVVAEWTSVEDKSHTIVLEPGTYVMHEEVAPEGYFVATDIPFTVNEDGTVESDAVKNGKVTMEDKPYPNVSIKKTDAVTTEELAGAELTVTDEAGNVVDSWTSNGTPHIIEKIAPGTYILTENQAPAGYNFAESITFEVDEDGVKGGIVEMKDAPYVEVSFTKKVLGGDELEGATIQILDKDGNVIDEWVSTAEPHIIKLPDGDYVMHEVAAPNGFYVATDIPFTVNSGNPEAMALVNMDDEQWGEVEISKVDAATTEELAGATLQIHKVNADGTTTLIEEWVSTGESHKIRLEEGTYTLTEISAPDGYNVAETITFEVGRGGLVEGAKVEMLDQPYTPVEFSKQDLGGKEIAGAEIQVLDKDGKLVTKWTSVEGESHTVSLPDGDYVMHEEVAPNGYFVATDIPFTVKAGTATNTTKVSMLDKPHPFVEISKVDATTKAELPGAKLTITDAAGNVVDSWTSTNETHKLQLAPGTYTLTEIAAPDGYNEAESIEFMVNEDGLVGSEKVVMEDEPIVIEEPPTPNNPPTPEEPPTPDNPPTPEEPPTPNNPPTPEEPPVPDVPTPPAPPVTDNPPTPAKPTPPATSTPKTADASAPFVAGLAGLALLAMLGGVVAAARSRKEEIVIPRGIDQS